MKSSYDIVIVGGGMVGTALACAFGGSDLKVAVLEAQPPRGVPADAFDLRVSAITLASRAFFENVGAWAGMARRRVAPVHAMQVWEEAQGKRGEIDFDAAEIAEPELAYIIENSVIHGALVERVQQFTNIHWLCPVEIGAIVSGEEVAEVRLADGRVLIARLLVGADGANSRVRAAAGIESDRLDLGQKGIVATVRTEKPHDAIARQRFLPSGPLAFLPLTEAHTCSIVWSADTARAEELLALDGEEFTEALAEASAGMLGRIESVSERAAFPFALTHARHYTAPRVALIGDAAHTVHPLAGQGANMGFLDAAALAGVVQAGAARRRDIGAHTLLRRYERARKGENLAMLAVTGGFRYLFGSRLSLVGDLRRFGLDLANRTPLLKHAITRRASGLAGDLPALARRGGPR